MVPIGGRGTGGCSRFNARKRESGKALWAGDGGFGGLGAGRHCAVINHPRVFAALAPRHAFAYISHANGLDSFTVLGSVFLALTGAKRCMPTWAFRRRAIRVDWFLLVMPALALNYLGQGALILAEPSAVSNPFFLLFQDWLLLPAVMLATVATVIASQAVISGAFALVQQAIQLGALPRLDVRQTSDESVGQVYVPQVNWLLAAAVLALVFGFRSSDALANAYGIAVAGDMSGHTLASATLARGAWAGLGWRSFRVMGSFLLLDVHFRFCQPAQDPGRWLVSIAGRRCRLDPDAVLAPRPCCRIREAR